MPQRIVDLQNLDTIGTDDYMVITDASDGQITKKILASSFAATTSGSPFSNAQLLTSGSTWNVPAGISQVMVFLVGPGGDGGGAGSSDPLSNGSGGNSGEVLSALYTVIPSGTVTYQVGDATTATPTTFGTLSAGAGLAGTIAYNGDAASPPGTQDLQYSFIPSVALAIINYQPAQGGKSGSYNPDTSSGIGGAGGSNPYGTGGAQLVAAGNGNNGAGYGSGGGGALNGSTTKTGGAGLDGCILVRY